MPGGGGQNVLEKKKWEFSPIIGIMTIYIAIYNVSIKRLAAQVKNIVLIAVIMFVHCAQRSFLNSLRP